MHLEGKAVPERNQQTRIALEPNLTCQKREDSRRFAVEKANPGFAICMNGEVCLPL